MSNLNPNAPSLLDMLAGAQVYQMMETAIIVSETFMNLLKGDKLDDDYVYGESESDTYAELIQITTDIERVNLTEKTMYFEDIREMAETKILEKYGKKEPKTYMVIETEADNHNGFKDKAKIIGQFSKRCEAEDLADKENSTRRWIIEQ